MGNESSASGFPSVMGAGAQATVACIFEPLTLLNRKCQSFNLEALCVANIFLHSLEYENVSFKREDQITIKD